MRGAGSMLYWTEVNSVRSRVMRCRLNGSDVTTITTSIVSPNGLFIDSRERRSVSLYVLQGVDGSVFQCDLMRPTVNYGQSHIVLNSVCLFVRLSVCPGNSKIEGNNKLNLTYMFPVTPIAISRSVDQIPKSA